MMEFRALHKSAAGKVPVGVFLSSTAHSELKYPARRATAPGVDVLRHDRAGQLDVPSCDGKSARNAWRNCGQTSLSEIGPAPMRSSEGYPARNPTRRRSRYLNGLVFAS